MNIENHQFRRKLIIQSIRRSPKIKKTAIISIKQLEKTQKIIH